MPTPRQDPTFQPGSYVFGYSLPGHAYFGPAWFYPQRSVFGSRPFGGQIAGHSTEDEMLKFLYGPPQYGYNQKHPCIPQMSMRVRSTWAKRSVFCVWRGVNVVRRYTPYDGSAKEPLVPTMLKLMEASFIWHLFDDGTKRQLDIDAARLGLRYPGYNWFTKLYIQDNPKWQEYV